MMNVNVIHVVNKRCNPTLDLVGYHWGSVVVHYLNSLTAVLLIRWNLFIALDGVRHGCQLCSDRVQTSEATLSADDHFSAHGAERYASALNLRRPLWHFGALYPNSGLQSSAGSPSIYSRDLLIRGRDTLTLLRREDHSLCHDATHGAAACRAHTSARAPTLITTYTTFNLVSYHLLVGDKTELLVVRMV